MERNEYISKVRELIERVKNGQDMRYFDGHLPRFNAQLDMFEAFLKDEEIDLVYDLGTDIPYATLYFNLTKNAGIYLGCVDTNDDREILPNVHRKYINLNRPPILAPADLVVCTECLEHLPSNLYMVRQSLCEYVRRGKFLLLSFPLKGVNAKDYGLDIKEINHDGSHQHIREFTEQTAKEFYAGAGFNLICEKITWTDAYGGNIMNVLLQKASF